MTTKHPGNPPRLTVSPLGGQAVSLEDARQSSERKKRELYLSHTIVSQGGSEDVRECCLSQLSVPAQWCRGQYFLFTDERKLRQSKPPCTIAVLKHLLE